MKMNTSVENYLVNGCGRCPLGNTPDCKVHSWTAELEYLRSIVLDCGLTEVSKWGVPSYTWNKKNILMVSAFREFCSVSFFKGVLLTDAENILEKPGENSQVTRLAKFTTVKEIEESENDLRACIIEAIEVEKAGLKVEFKKNPEPFPEELEEKFMEDPAFKSAFEALTPGRQRGYILHFSQPKQSKTRISRIEKCTPLVMNGVGLHDKYKSNRK